MLDCDEIVTRIRAIYHSSEPEDQYYLRQILEEIAATGESPTYQDIWLHDYIEIPVDIKTFLESDAFLGKVTRNGKAIYPHWHQVLEDLFSSSADYEECIFTGATRIGKSSTAITATSYMLYKLMCLRDPQEYFGKKDVSKFSILFFNITKDLAKQVGYREFNDTLAASPWFMSHGHLSQSEQNFYYIPDGGKIVIDYGSTGAHALGQQVFVGYCDECNFAKAGIKDIQKAKAAMKDTYNTIATRVKGTFRKNGHVLGKMFAVSSKKSDSDFMEEYVRQQRAAGVGNKMFVDDHPQWEVLPSSMFSKEKFYIAVGDRHKRGFVVPDTQTQPEAIEELKSQGYTILTPPRDMLSDFMADFDIALRDLAGISVPGALSFITQEALNACINKSRRSPFYNDIIQTGTKDKLTIEEFFHIKEVEHLKRFPGYIHLDLSLNTDKSGIGYNCISGRKDVVGEDGKIVSSPMFTHVFSVSIEAPRGDSIPYDKITKFVVWLRRNGFNIQGVSRDQFQSEYLGQLLEAQGFKVSRLSLDRTPDGYIALRSVLLEQRIDMLDHKLLQDELIHLQRDAFSGRIDHQLGGSKDAADGFAGSIWNATLSAPAVPVDAKAVANAVVAVNGPRVPVIGTSSSLGQAMANLYNNPRKR
ncbi:hypothetical protein [uncultured Duncaniella sp.]|uniref:hypothetical protein n=1 Tax=uncultured Duncaniella sp. TaxID=2768039 RepID=UPI002617D2C4|nr:hypothetical protein [uncultured Duncaniella sp.]